MEFERAKKIFNSSDKIEVFYNGEPIWITNVNENNHTVEIQNIDSQQNTIQVNTDKLLEGRIIK